MYVNQIQITIYQIFITLPFSLHSMNKNSATRSRTSTTGEVNNLHSFALKVVPSSGRCITSLKGGKI